MSVAVGVKLFCALWYLFANHLQLRTLSILVHDVDSSSCSCALIFCLVSHPPTPSSALFSFLILVPHITHHFVPIIFLFSRVCISHRALDLKRF